MTEKCLAEEARKKCQCEWCKMEREFFKLHCEWLARDMANKILNKILEDKEEQNGNR